MILWALPSLIETSLIESYLVLLFNQKAVRDTVLSLIVVNDYHLHKEFALSLSHVSPYIQARPLKDEDDNSVKILTYRRPPIEGITYECACIAVEDSNKSSSIADGFLEDVHVSDDGEINMPDACCFSSRVLFLSSIVVFIHRVSASAAWRKWKRAAERRLDGVTRRESDTMGRKRPGRTSVIEMP